MPKQVKKSLVLSIYFILAVSTLLVFWQVRNFDFVNYDDNIYVYENPHILNGLTGDGIIWSFTTGQATNWHPLTWLSLMLDCQLFGPNPGMIHLVNVFFHIANTLLLFAVLKKMTGSLWPSAFVAAAFALHPMHVESVAWIAERKDVLSTFFWILTMLAYLRYVKKPDAVRYMLTLLIFALGLMAKPMLVTLPFVLLLLDYWPLERFGRRTVFYLFREKIPFFALSIVSSIITFLVQRSGGAVTNIDILPLNSRIANAFLSYAEYIGKMFWPCNLAVFYPFNADITPFWQVAACALLLLGISVFAVYFGRNQRYLTLGWFWFVAALVPVIGIVQVGQQAYADRYTYIPYIGLFIMLAWYLPQLLSKWPHRKIVLGVLMVVVLTAIGVSAHRQTSYWNNGITLFSHTIEVTKNNYIVYNNLGNAYSKLGRFTEAIDAYQQAVKIKPGYAMVYYNLGIAYGNLNRLPQAIDAFNQTIIVKPDYAEAQYNLGVVYGKLGRTAEAIDAYQQAIKIKPDYAEAHYNLGNAYSDLSRYAEAIDVYKQAVKIKPDYAAAHANLGVAYLAIGDKNSALAEYNILKSLNSEFANNLLKDINE